MVSIPLIVREGHCHGMEYIRGGGGRIGKWETTELKLTTCLAVVLDEDYLSKRIVVENVTHYAYGQHNDGEVGIWVSGRAGWFSISPAKGYRPMFNEMVEAIDLLYFLADRHQKKRRKRKDWNPSLEYLCEEVGVTII